MPWDTADPTSPVECTDALAPMHRERFLEKSQPTPSAGLLSCRWFIFTTYKQYAHTRGTNRRTSNTTKKAECSSSSAPETCTHTPIRQPNQLPSLERLVAKRLVAMFYTHRALTYTSYYAASPNLRLRRICLLALCTTAGMCGTGNAHAASAKQIRTPLSWFVPVRIDRSATISTNGNHTPTGPASTSFHSFASPSFASFRRGDDRVAGICSLLDQLPRV